MSAIADIWESERGLMAVALILSSTVLAAMKVITADAWLSYSKWIFTTYAAGKTLTGVVAMHTETRPRTRTRKSTATTTTTATDPPAAADGPGFAPGYVPA